MKWFAKGLCAFTALVLTSGASCAKAESILFWSGQAAPLPEAQAMRDQALKGFPGVDFQSREGGPFITRLEAEFKAGRGSIGLVGPIRINGPTSRM